MQAAVVDHTEVYRLPWSLTDNAISWLEPTALCNLYCDGCYRMNEKDSHKSLDVVKQELDTFQKLRNSDCISIAGGDPLLHPQILDIVADVKRRGLKPIVNTNGKALTMELLKDLKKAGVYGFTFHVDSKQGRDGKWAGKTEIELNALRQEYADMLAKVGGISCSFNSTVYEDTMQYMPDMLNWAHRNIDIVHTMVFIAYREVIPDMPFDWYAGGQKVDWDKIWYHTDRKRDINISALHMLQKARETHPEFMPCGYLNGTEIPDSFKWMLNVRVGTKEKIFGFMGPKFIELVMTGYHWFTGKYLSYASPKETRIGRTALMFLWMLDKGARKAAGRFFTNPLNWFKRLHFQTVMFIQPVDFTKHGGQSMCDSCPDITVWNGQLVWSCRLEELKKYNTFLKSVPKD
ncbi:Radical SAM domain protein [Chloroherpeton thalassium ATCC 35110]|uniref:Radical SAM domain protein n=1 Tax=Chloroherpeton thalassium (strain ATCC 35110 / GB-78) TaxID=517418 RepID=B3QSI3_CHLT3|nr:radical SAM protein [Chloroherpeton thalassium]ACF12574.1 Radical SAM domain protein [Chloroherpeton thalassium ATCC 35110]